MRKLTQLVTIGLLIITLAGLSVTPMQGAQDKATSPTHTKKEVKKTKHLPFHGTVKAVDAKKRTVTVGKRVFQINQDAKIMKDGKPAKLEDAKVGEKVGGAYRKGEDGSLNCFSIRFGPKPEKKKTTTASTP